MDLRCGAKLAYVRQRAVRIYIERIDAVAELIALEEQRIVRAIENYVGIIAIALEWRPSNRSERT